MKFLPCALLLLLTSSLSASEPRSREKGLFEFRDGDRVVFLGSAFIERLQNTGYLETMLTAAMPTKNITFRNLGWSGDTVWGDARAVFGSRADGFKRLLSDVVLCKPTVLIVCYGENEAYAGEAGLEEFRTGLSKLLDSLEATGTRIVLLGPRQHEKRPPPLPDEAKYNADLRKYNDVIGRVAKEREHNFVDLFDIGISKYPNEAPGNDVKQVVKDIHTLTKDGVHLSDYGNQEIAHRLPERLGVFEEMRAFQINARTSSYDVVGATIFNAEITPNRIVIESLDRRIPFVSRENTNLRLTTVAPVTGVLEVTGMEPGKYELKVDGRVVKRYDIQSLEAPWYIDPKSESQFDSLRQAINEKNTLFFHRYRPQNETYLFLFRKQEQGNNAVEIPQFDPLITELEKKIAELKQPVKQKYELVKVK